MNGRFFIRRRTWWTLLASLLGTIHQLWTTTVYAKIFTSIKGINCIILPLPIHPVGLHRVGVETIGFKAMQIILHCVRLPACLSSPAHDNRVRLMSTIKFTGPEVWTTNYFILCAAGGGGKLSWKCWPDFYETSIKQRSRTHGWRSIWDFHPLGVIRSSLIWRFPFGGQKKVSLIILQNILWSLTIAKERQSSPHPHTHRDR